MDLYRNAGRGRYPEKTVCCVVLHEPMFVQGLCVERNKTSSLIALKLNSTLDD